jgi:hypothetical protein
MKPSERIYNIENSNMPHWAMEKATEKEIMENKINAVIQYLDEQYEKKLKVKN